MRFLLFFLFLTMPMIWVTCTKDKLPDPDPNPMTCDPIPTYDMEIQVIVNNSCAIPTCHVSGGNAPGVYTTYAGMLAELNNGQMESEVIDQRDMPRPPGTLTSGELELFRCWLAAGFPE